MSYIEFRRLPSKRKTSVWSVCATRSGKALGVVQWFTGWRQYCFMPLEDTVFSKGCMEDINDFISQLMQERA